MPTWTVTNIVTEQGVVLMDTETSVDTPMKNLPIIEVPEDAPSLTKKRRLFVDTVESENGIPERICHLRDSQGQEEYQRKT